MIDYKISQIRRDDNSTTVVVKFYKGAITTKDEIDNLTREAKAVTRYRRSKLLGERTWTVDKDITDEQIEIFLNRKLAEKAVEQADTPHPKQVTPERDA